MKKLLFLAALIFISCSDSDKNKEISQNQEVKNTSSVENQVKTEEKVNLTQPQETKQEVQEVKQEIQATKQVQEIKQEIKPIVSNGEKIYNQVCKTCHGANGELNAMNASRPLKDLSAKEIEEAFPKYATDENYGGKLKATMKPYSNKYKQDDLKEIISYLKDKNIIK